METRGGKEGQEHRVEWHLQRRLPSAVAVHVPRGGGAGPGERNRGWSWREAVSVAVLPVGKAGLPGRGSWIPGFLNREVTFPQGLLKALLTVACRGIRPGRNVGMVPWEAITIIHEGGDKSCQIITSECGISYICVKFQSSYSIIKHII